VATVSEVSNDVKISARAHVPGLPIWDVEPFDRPVIPGGADLGLPRAATPREDHGPNGVQMTPQAELELEVDILRLRAQPVERELMLCAPPTGH
jgi:hypothetical protein